MFELKKEYLDAMVSQARAEAPNECCGILAGKDGQVTKLYRATNAEHSPKGYSVAPDELFQIYQEIDRNGWEILAIYHSHPQSPAWPSPIDLKYAYYPAALYIIISLANPCQPVVKAFHIVKDKISAEAVRIVD